MVSHKLLLGILSSLQLWCSYHQKWSDLILSSKVKGHLQMTPQDPSVQTVLTWCHQRLCIYGLYGTIQMLLLLCHGHSKTTYRQMSTLPGILLPVSGMHRDETYHSYSSRQSRQFQAKT